MFNTANCVCVKRITLCNCLCSSSTPSSRFSASLNRNIGEFGAKNYFTDHWTPNKVQLFVTIKRKFFFRTSRSKGEFPIGYLINIATCLFAYH